MGRPRAEAGWSSEMLCVSSVRYPLLARGLRGKRRGNPALPYAQPTHTLAHNRFGQIKIIENTWPKISLIKNNVG